MMIATTPRNHASKISVSRSDSGRPLNTERWRMATWAGRARGSGKGGSACSSSVAGGSERRATRTAGEETWGAGNGTAAARGGETRRGAIEAKA